MKKICLLMLFILVFLVACSNQDSNQDKLSADDNASESLGFLFEHLDFSVDDVTIENMGWAVLSFEVFDDEVDSVETYQMFFYHLEIEHEADVLYYTVSYIDFDFDDDEGPEEKWDWNTGHDSLEEFNEMLDFMAELYDNLAEDEDDDRVYNTNMERGTYSDAQISSFRNNINTE